MKKETPFELAKKQRSHNLYVFSNAAQDQDQVFSDWLKGKHLEAVAKLDKVLFTQHFERQNYDPTNGVSKPSDYRYLGVYELSLDGAEQAGTLIDQIITLHKSQKAAGELATWLYYPVSEKVGRAPKTKQWFMALAFANAVEGTEAVFREWYSTQHIRHALIVPTMASGQRFELTGFQQPGISPGYESLAVYEMEGTVDDLASGLPSVDPETLIMSPSFDMKRFAEWLYYPITERI